MKIKTLITLHADGEIVKPGESIDLNENEAMSLIHRGFAVTDRLSDKESSESETSIETNDVPSLEDIIEVIEMLNPETDFGKSGKPNVDAIESVLEANISADMRDQAWEQFQKDREAETQ